MVINEFVEATSRLERYFNKEYTDDQRKIMFDTLKDLSLPQYTRGINYCISNCKYLPKIADIKEGVSHLESVKENKPKIDFIKCDKCSDGFVRYFREISNGDKKLKYEYVALCSCANGMKQKTINGYNIPFINEIGL